MSFLNFLLLNVFTALLPPVDPDEPDYYECLGLPKRGGGNGGTNRGRLVPRPFVRTPHVALDDIRKAYKQKSLELHPDKVAQRRHIPPEQAAAEYERVQEAYACLSDAKHRKAYHELGCSNVRYRFVRGGMVHPIALYENLQRSSWFDKTRLVGLVTVALLLVLLQPILMAAKVNQSVGSSVFHHDNSGFGPLQETPWTVILIPLWVGYAFLLTFWLVLACVVEDRKARRLVICSFFQHVCCLAGCVLLALAWDQGLALQVLQAQQVEQLGYGIPLFPAWEWHELSVPFYLALLLRMLEDALTIDLIKSERSKLVTPEQFIKLQHEHTNAAASSSNINNGATEGEEAEEERLNKLEEEYTVVTVLDEEVALAVAAMREERAARENRVAEESGDQPPPSSSDASAILSDEELEHLKVRLSPEYEALSDAIRSQLRSIGTTVLFGIPFVALVACKLQAQIKVNWWVVFVPIWVWLGAKVVSSCCMCCLASALPMGGELVVVEQHAAGDHRRANAGGGGGGGDEQAGNGDGGDAAAAASSKEPQPQRMDAKLTASNPNVNTGGDTQTRGNVGAKVASPSDASVKSSEIEFASPEGNMNQFNEAADKKQPHHSTSLTTSTTTAPGAESSGNSKNDKADQSSGNNVGSTETGEDDEEFPFDSEAFHAWQQAHAETEQSALEARAKAQSACCMSSFVLIIICLIVGKLEQNYPSAENPVNPPQTPGYNAFWVLFPIFVVMGSILCCCSCLIYGAGGSSLDDLVDKAKTHGDEGDSSREEQQQSSTIVIPMPADTDTPEQQSSASATAKAHSSLPANAQSGSTDVGTGGDMNDLD